MRLGRLEMLLSARWLGFDLWTFGGEGRGFVLDLGWVTVELHPREALTLEWWELMITAGSLIVALTGFAFALSAAFGRRG